ncbi:C6 zinc finger domain-containing [Fusarium albosuccineum]|uniref:C6 zinc finger domain-containing n=1 Tax=Fusarium albosuccineum TaxID=1237068 RepID=A0A8H4P6Z1_9HYPO|nr:C6 zinc finger domain-containing [Fusarium albosuccineum]
MKRHGPKISKACDSCCRRKTKCDGQQPCHTCQRIGNPSECSYRSKARVRHGTSFRPASTGLARRPEVDGVPSRSSPSIPAVSAASLSSQPPSVDHQLNRRNHQHNGVVATDFDGSQVFYGQASMYSTAQQLRRMMLQPVSLLSADSRQAAQDINVALDMFMQRYLFFGFPLRAEPFAAPIICSQGGVTAIVPKLTSARFLDNFKAATLHILPFFSDKELDHLLDAVYNSASPTSVNISFQHRALLLIILASGALCEVETELAETLFLLSKQETWLHEDTVTLEMIQFSLLAADYQLNMGRATSGYLYIGAACRKAFAMGLTVTRIYVGSSQTQDEQRRVTLWCLYFFDW